MGALSETNAPKKRDTKQRLIDTALELIWRSSYGAISVDDICKSADVKKGSFYHFFPSKVDLAIAAMDASFAGFQLRYDQIFAVEINVVERFSRLADYIYESQAEVAARYGQVCGCPCTSVGSEMAGQQDGIRLKFAEMIQRKELYYESALRDMAAIGLLASHIDPAALAHEVTVYLLGQMMVARIQNDLEPLRRDLKPGLLRLLGLLENAKAA